MFPVEIVVVVVIGLRIGFSVISFVASLNQGHYVKGSITVKNIVQQDKASTDRLNSIEKNTMNISGPAPQAPTP